MHLFEFHEHIKSRKIVTSLSPAGEFHKDRVGLDRKGAHISAIKSVHRLSDEEHKLA